MRNPSHELTFSGLGAGRGVKTVIEGGSAEENVPAARIEELMQNFFLDRTDRGEVEFLAEF
jgi:hypothetical protein